MKNGELMNERIEHGAAKRSGCLQLGLLRGTPMMRICDHSSPTDGMQRIERLLEKALDKTANSSEIAELNGLILGDVKLLRYVATRLLDDAILISLLKEDGHH